ncbi:MAG: hypothetical protein ACO2O1_10490, partial [Candidatus Caldarchaeales archaeon]
MMAGTAGDEVLFKGRGFKTVLQELFEGALIFAGAGLLYEGFRSLAGRPGEAILMVLIGLAMFYLFYLTFIKGTIGHRKRITVYRSGIDVNGSYVRWEHIRGIYYDEAMEPTRLATYMLPAKYEAVHTVEVESVDGRRLTF